MLNRLLTTLLTIVVVAVFAREANAQYLYLDSNGNGVRDTGDRLNGNGAATTVDLYVRTNQNRDGSPATCDTGSDPLTINSYYVNLTAAGGTVAYSGFVNQQPSMAINVGELNPADGVRYANGFSGATQLSPGSYRLATLTITGTAGSPRIDIVDLVNGSGNFTGFGTLCPGRGFDNVYRLDGPNARAFLGGPGDFTDWDGLGPAGGPNNRPAVTNPGNKTVNEFSTLAFSATATDPDAGQTLTWSLTLGIPAANGATISPSTGAFSWTPTAAQANQVYPLTITATDNGIPPLSGSAAITITVNHVDNFPPVIANPGNKTTNEQQNLAFTVTATDSDLPPQTITWSLALGTPAATGATINASTGAFGWTPTEIQGPGFYPVTVTATDNGTPALSGSAAFTITVTEVNSAPVVTSPGNRTVAEQALLAFTAAAVDVDVPANTIAWSLTLGTPAATGATIGAGSGAFSWSPTEAQGPGLYPVTIVATDNGSPALSGSAPITITVIEVNTAPVLAPIGNKIACGPGAPFAFTATATDVDIPANTLTFSLDAGAPPGATIGASTGAFSWTPSAFGTFPVTVRVTDNGAPALSDFEVITITVSAMPQPVLATIGNKSTDELAALTFTAAATGGTPPYTFSLDPGAPAGATINPSTGAFTWTPSEAQGPGSYPITIRLTDNSACQASDFEAITVVVNEVNVAPILAAIGNKTGIIGSPVTFTATASDADVPANTLTFSLDAGAPSGATINASTGAFSWTPSSTGTFPVTVRVTDNGTPALSDYETISIELPPCLGCGLQLSAIGNKTVNELSLLAFTATATDPDPGQTLTFSLDAGAPAGATINASTGTFTWTPTEMQGPGSYPITVRVTDNGTPPASDFETITVTVREVNSAPFLAAIGNKTIDIGATLVFTASAFDSDIPANVLTFSLDAGVPVGATINGASGAFAWTPSFAQIGVFPITVRATDNGAPPLSAFETITVQVIFVDGHPLANAGGPYTGVVNTPVNFDGTGSSDPTGETLTYAWSFGDGSTGTGVTPAHAYSAPGTYTVTLRVTDPLGNYDDATTTVTILSEIPVALLLKNGKSTLNLGDDILKLGLEELELPYSSVLVSTLRLSTDFPNAGTVAECSPDAKHTRIGDLDRNGVSDLELRFPIACIRDLFRNTPNNSTVNLILTGQFQTSTGTVPLRGVKVVTIKRGGGGSAPVLAYPNPFNPEGRLSFVTTRPGSASIQLFDLQGRLVRTLLPQQYLGAGAHEIMIDGLNDQGLRLSSGVYFYRLSAADGITEGSINILK